MWMNGIETAARTVLYLAIASACVLAPIEYIKQHSAETELKDAARKAQQDLAEALEKKAEKPVRFTIASMGPSLTLLSPSNAQGQLWFTNVSSRAGEMCLYAVAQNHTTHKESSSIAACQLVDAYASAHMSFMFAGGDLTDSCPSPSACELRIFEAPENGS
jgi:hypothetical protein